MFIIRAMDRSGNLEFSKLFFDMIFYRLQKKRMAKMSFAGGGIETEPASPSRFVLLKWVKAQGAIERFKN